MLYNTYYYIYIINVEDGYILYPLFIITYKIIISYNALAWQCSLYHITMEDAFIIITSFNLFIIVVRRLTSYE
jgi:hypothetical protein